MCGSIDVLPISSIETMTPVILCKEHISYLFYLTCAHLPLCRIMADLECDTRSKLKTPIISKKCICVINYRIFNYSGMFIALLIL